METKQVKFLTLTQEELMKIPSAWIDRSGIYYPVGIAEHDSWAWSHLIEKYGKLEAGRKISDARTASEYLEKAGWVRVMKWPGLEVKFIFSDKLTHAQKQTLDKYCQIYKEPLPFEDPLF